MVFNDVSKKVNATIRKISCKFFCDVFCMRKDGINNTKSIEGARKIDVAYFEGLRWILDLNSPS